MLIISRKIAVATLACMIVIPATSIAAEGGAPMSGLSSKDKQFMEKAAQAGHAEVAVGKLADSKSSNAEVERFARKMVHDHEKAGDELKKIAQSKGVMLPEEPDPAHKTLAKTLEAAKADEFDRVYIAEAGVKDHKEAVDLFTDQAKNGQDSDLKSFAAKTLPTIKDHYQMAQELDKSAGKKR